MATSERLGLICTDPAQKKVLRSLTTDEGYFDVDEVCYLQEEQVRTIMGDPHATRRNPAKQSKVERSVLNKARRAMRSKSGKALLRKRGEPLEWSFCHVLDHRGVRQATLRGREDLTKRQLGGAMTFNLSLLMRHLTGVGCLFAEIWSHYWTRLALRAVVFAGRGRSGNFLIIGRLIISKSASNRPRSNLALNSTGC